MLAERVAADSETQPMSSRRIFVRRRDPTDSAGPDAWCQSLLRPSIRIDRRSVPGALYAPLSWLQPSRLLLPLLTELARASPEPAATKPIRPGWD